MSSQALYRKWRSQTFDDVVGQAHIVQSLRNALAANRIGHAYLFTGPRGVGKTSVARILAKAVNCEHPDPAHRPCGACAACVAVADGRAVDVIEMDAASHTSVDDAREIIERVQFRPTSFRYKVYIIDEVHMISTAAFNALLKTLEEPPDHAMFILATTEFHKVPETIISRCQRFVFSRHTIQDTADHLRQIAQAEGVTLENGAAEAIARAATGSMRDAVSTLDQLIGYGDALVRLDQVRSLLGATAAREVQALVEALASDDVAAALSVINAVADQGADLRQFTRDVVQYLRGLMLLHANGDPALLDVSTDDLAAMQQFVTQLDLAALLAWLKVFSGLDHQLRTSPYGQLPLEMAVVEALVVPAPAASAPTQAPVVRPVQPRRGQQVSEAPPAAAPAQRPPRTSDASAAAEQVAPTRVSAPAARAEPDPEPLVSVPVAVEPPPVVASADQQRPDPSSIDDSEVLLAQIEAVWEQLIDDLKPYNPRLQAVMRGCDPIELQDTTLIIGAQSPFHQRQLSEDVNRRLLEDILSKIMERQFMVQCELINKEQQSRARDARRQREELMKDHFVKMARNIFDARIVGIQEDR